MYYNTIKGIDFLYKKYKIKAGIMWKNRYYYLRIKKQIFVKHINVEQ